MLGWRSDLRAKLETLFAGRRLTVVAKLLAVLAFRDAFFCSCLIQKSLDVDDH